MTQYVYDPRGRVPAPAIRPAPRPAAIDTLRIAVLDNSKWNAARLLRAIVAELERAGPIGPVTHYRKATYTRAAEPALLDRIAADNDLALIAIGD